MAQEQESRGSEEGLCEWLIGQILETTYLERLMYIGRVIADDKQTQQPYLTEDCRERLQAAWRRKRKQIETAGSLPSVQGESTDRSEHAAATNRSNRAEQAK